MAEGLKDTPEQHVRQASWTEIFRGFQVALDPRKLLTAAAGILAMSIGWFLLAQIFHYPAPLENDDKKYGSEAGQRSLGKKVEGASPEDAEAAFKKEGKRLYQRDLAEWKIVNDLAGPNGRMSTLPWNEYRGPNPYLVLTKVVGGTSVDLSTTAHDVLSGTVPVLIEPLRKILLPIAYLLDPHIGFVTRLYLLLSFAWCVAVWAFFGGIITRIAAVQFSGKDRITMSQAIKFVTDRYVSYLLSPLVPLGVVGVIVIAMALYGFVALIPVVGDLVLYGIGMPLVVFGGIAIAVLLVGLVGYPLMCTTLSVEGSDTFDALSRSYNYVFQAPWTYLWYWLVSIAYGLFITLFVVLMGSLSVYMGKWAVCQAPFSESSDRKPDFLFTHAPESFGWKELLLAGSPIEQEEFRDGQVKTYRDKNEAAAEQYRKEMTKVEKLGSWMVSFWLALIFLVVIGFSYSYFWTVSTMIYLLMRKNVDETEMDEIYIEEETNDMPIAPPTPSTPATPTGSVSLPMAPASSTPAAPAPQPPTAPPPATPAASAESHKTEEPKAEEPKPETFGFAPKTDG